jgi:hypothetical protein
MANATEQPSRMVWQRRGEWVWDEGRLHRRFDEHLARDREPWAACRETLADLVAHLPEPGEEAPLPAEETVDDDILTAAIESTCQHYQRPRADFGNKQTFPRGMWFCALLLRQRFGIEVVSRMLRRNGNRLEAGIRQLQPNERSRAESLGRALPQPNTEESPMPEIAKKIKTAIEEKAEQVAKRVEHRWRENTDYATVEEVVKEYEPRVLALEAALADLQRKLGEEPAGKRKA